jgi:hypothetical protein
MHLDVRKAGVIVHGHVEVVVADPALAVSRAPLAPEHPPTAAGRDPTELLHVHVDQLSRASTFVADRGPGGTVQFAQARRTVPAEHPGDRRTGMPEPRTQPVRPPSEVTTGTQDLGDLSCGQRVRAPVGCRRAIE